MANKISQETGVELCVVSNVIQYAKNLVPEDNADVIDEKVFVAQMGLRFGITSRYHIQLMFECKRMKKATKKHMTLEDYVRIVCIFQSPILDVKIDFVFAVYNFKQSGFLEVSEITALLRTSIIHTGEDTDPDDALNELVNLVLSVTDTNQDGLISPDEFRAFVKHDILCIQLFGTVLPNERILEKFHNLMKYSQPHQIKERFADERMICLSEFSIHKKENKLYPGVQLDFS